MVIVAIGWMYVVTLMAATEPSVVGGIMTFFGYGVFPLSIVYYLATARQRRLRRLHTARGREAEQCGPGPDAPP